MHIALVPNKIGAGVWKLNVVFITVSDNCSSTLGRNPDYGSSYGEDTSTTEATSPSSF